MSDSRLEKFIYAICSMEVSDLPAPLSRIEKLWNYLITGETPDFEPQSRNEKYLMAMIGSYDISNLPAPMSRGEKLLYKIAVGETDLSDVPGYLSRYEELLKYLIENGGIGGGDSGGDFEYVLHTLNQSLSTLYSTAEKPVKSAILSGNTCYRDIDTGEILESFEEGRNLELVSVKMPVLTTTGKNLINKENIVSGVFSSDTLAILQNNKRLTIDKNNAIKVKPNTTYTLSYTTGYKVGVMEVNATKTAITADSKWQVKPTGHTFTTDTNTYYMTFNISKTDDSVIALSDKDTLNLMLEQGSVATSYEPFKSNILSTSEEVVLRSLPNGVNDTLNLMTGEYVQRIGEMKITDEMIDKFTIYDNFINNFNSIFNGLPERNTGRFGDTPSTISMVSDKMMTKPWSSGTMLENVVYFSQYNGIMRAYHSPDWTLDEFKEWFRENKPTIQYELVTPVVKTVVLTTVDQDGQPTELKTFNDITHVEIKANNLIPSVDLEVATKISQTLSTMGPQQLGISETQNKLGQTIDEQTENTDATMMATTEIYEQTL